jgi:hypothetical protein
MSRRSSRKRFCLSSKSRPVPGMNCHMPAALAPPTGLRVERAFDEGQQRQVGGHLPAFEFLDDVEQVARAACRHALHVVGALRVVLLPLAHQLAVQVGHGEALAHALPQVGADASSSGEAHPCQRSRCCSGAAPSTAVAAWPARWAPGRGAGAGGATTTGRQAPGHATGGAGARRNRPEAGRAQQPAGQRQPVAKPGFIGSGSSIRAGGQHVAGSPLLRPARAPLR